ncbi:MAG: hypothetical protein DRO14_02005 [Thermoprotei archaeon]|nr:MAG: hypothetical protein DRO14_02005 [Thermoprotei archaeon]
MKVVTFKIDEALLERIDRLALQLGVPRSEIIREALLNFLNGGSVRVGKKSYIKIRHVILT